VTVAVIVLSLVVALQQVTIVWLAKPRPVKRRAVTSVIAAPSLSAELLQSARDLGDVPSRQMVGFDGV
jgi:hypothetical protein